MDTDFLGSDTNEAGQDISQFDAPELSELDYTEHLANMVANALQATNLFEIVELKAGVIQFHIMGRVRKDNEKNVILKIVKPILGAVSDSVDIFMGKQYILKNGNVVYAWVLSVSSQEIKKAAYTICEVLSDSIPKFEVMESPLLGAPTPQTNGYQSGKRGAAPVR